MPKKSVCVSMYSGASISREIANAFILILINDLSNVIQDMGVCWIAIWMIIIISTVFRTFYLSIWEFVSHRQAIENNNKN